MVCLALCERSTIMLKHVNIGSVSMFKLRRMVSAAIRESARCKRELAIALADLDGVRRSCASFQSRLAATTKVLRALGAAECESCGTFTDVLVSGDDVDLCRSCVMDLSQCDRLLARDAALKEKP